jgi:uncharacterized membrane protein
MPGGGGGTSENSNGTIALVTGILSFFVCPVVLSIVAIVFGRKGLASVAAGRADNGGQAKAGYIMGIVSLILFVVFIIFYIVLFVVLAANSNNMS